MSHRVFATLFIPAVALASCVTMLVVGQQPMSAQGGVVASPDALGSPGLAGDLVKRLHDAAGAAGRPHRPGGAQR